MPTDQAGPPRGGGGGSTGSGGGGPSGTDFLNEARKFLGDPYVYGGAGPTVFDCSGLVQYALQQVGLKDVPRTSEAQWDWVNKVSQSDLQPGDLVFSQWPGDDAPPGHVAIYAGDGQILEAPKPGESVHVIPLNSYYQRFVTGYGRVPGLGTGGGGTAGGGGGTTATQAGLPKWLNGLLGNLPGSDQVLPGNGGSSGGGGMPAGTAGVLGTVLGPISIFAQNSNQALTQAMHGLLWIINPMNWVRLICGVLGGAAVVVGAVLLYQAA